MHRLRLRDSDLLIRQRRADPIRHLIVGHAESAWMGLARDAADAAASCAALLAALLIAGVAR